MKIKILDNFFVASSNAQHRTLKYGLFRVSLAPRTCHRILISFIGVVSLVFFTGTFSPSALAQDSPAIILTGPAETIKEGGRVSVEVKLNSVNDPINTLSVVIDFDERVLEVESLSDGNSIINYWVARPVVRADGKVSFSGVIPGGFNGDGGRLLVINFLAKGSGTADVAVEEAKLLKHDGLATPLAATLTKLTLTAAADGTYNSVESADTLAPEPFTILVSRDPAIFDNNFFIVFATQDKGSGIDHYEVQEGRGQFVKTSSPYQLADQSLRQGVVVRAVDRAGNERRSEWKPVAASSQSWSGPSKKAILVVGGLIILVIFFLIYRKLWRH